MTACRLFSGFIAGVAFAVAFAATTRSSAAEKDSKLVGAADKAERILIGLPEKKGVEAGQPIEVAPGEQFFIEIQRALRGTLKSSRAIIVNGGDAKQHPKFIAGRPYLFLLKKDADGKRWVHMGGTAIPVRGGKVQYLENGKVVEELAINDFEDRLAPEAPAIPTRDTLTGKWLFVMSDKGADAYLWLIDFTKDETQEGAARLISSSKLIEAATLKSSSVEDGNVHLGFDADGAILDFRGRFEKGTIRGSALLGRSRVLPARLEPTDVKNMRDYDKPIPDPAREEYQDAAKQEESFGLMSRFVRRRPESPLAIPAFLDLVAQARSVGYDRAKFETLAGDYLRSAKLWGGRMELRAYVEMGLLLSRYEYLPDLSLEYLTTADQKFDDETPREWKQSVGIERGKRLIAAGKAADGVAVLTRIRGDYPFEPEVTFALAGQAEKEGQVDQALELYGEIAVLPLVEQSLVGVLKSVGKKLSREQLPSRIVTRLWTDKHGDDRKGLSTWLDELYESKIRSIATEKRPPRKKDEGTRVVLCELFTNGDCPPCVGADVAISALESTYAKSEVVVLRYHQHQPGPDPLANDETVERFKQYQGTATPMILLNGRRAPGGGGPMSEAPETYRMLRTYIDRQLEEQIDLRLELSAKADQGKIALAATAQGIREFPPNARMLLVLAEEKVACSMNNGIRTHEMVARAFPGKLVGIAPVKGKLAYTGEIDLGKIKTQLSKQLVETERKNGIVFDEKPLDLKSLQFVAILQNVETGEVLQAAAVPVSSSTALPSDAKPTGKSDKPAAGGN